MDMVVIIGLLVVSLLIFLYLRNIKKAKFATVYISHEIGYPKAFDAYHRKLFDKKIIIILIFLMIFFLFFLSLPSTDYAMEGSIYVNSPYSGASVYLDGIYQGKTPATLSDVSPGMHKVKCRLSGYSDYETTATITAGATSTVMCSFFLLPTPTILPYILSNINVSPENAFVPVGSTQRFVHNIKDQYGNSIEPNVTWNSSDQSVGTIDSSGLFTAIAPGTTIITATIGTVKGKAIVMSVSIAPTNTPRLLSIEENSIFVNSSYSGASVYLDGIYQGKTPITLSYVSPGMHKVKCSLSGYSDYETMVTITAGDTAKVTCLLSPINVPIIKVVSEPAYIVIGQTSVIKVTVTRKDNQAISGASIMLSAIPGGNFSSISGITDLNGTFVSNFSGNAEGIVIINASVRKEGFAEYKADTMIEIYTLHSSSDTTYPITYPIEYQYSPSNLISRSIILFALLVAIVYLATRKKEPIANSLKIPTKMYEGDSNIIILHLAECASNGIAQPLYFIDANSKKQPLGIEIPSYSSPKFIEVELLAPGLDVEGEKRQKNEIFIAHMIYQWGICPPHPGNYEIGLVFRSEDAYGHIGELGVITRTLNVMKLFGLTGRQIGILTSISQILTWILAIILGLNTLGYA